MDAADSILSTSRTCGASYRECLRMLASWSVSFRQQDEVKVHIFPLIQPHVDTACLSRSMRLTTNGSGGAVGEGETCAIWIIEKSGAMNQNHGFIETDTLHVT